MKKLGNILLKIWQSNPIQGGVAAIVVSAIILGIIILFAFLFSSLIFVITSYFFG